MISNIMSRWSIATTMRMISGLSLVIFLVVLGMNHYAIGQVHAIGTQINQSTQRFKSLWQLIAIDNAVAETHRYALLANHEADITGKMHQTLAKLAANARAIEDQDAVRVLEQVTEYGRLFDALAAAFKNKQERVEVLQKQREAMEILVYEAGNSTLETAIVELKSSEVLYFWNPVTKRADSLRVLMDRLDRDGSGAKIEGKLLSYTREYREILRTLEALEAEIKQLGTNLGTVAQSVGSFVNAAVAKADQSVEEALARSDHLANEAQNSTLWWTLLGVLVPLTLTFLFDRSFNPRIRALVAGLYKVAEGNLSIHIDETGHDEIAALAKATNEMRSHLENLVSQVGAVALNVHSAAEEISATMDNQAATSMQMSASVTQIGATMEELSASSGQIAEYSKSVVDNAYQTWETSKNGSKSMQTVVEKMQDIKDDNQRSLKEIIELGGNSKEIGRIMEIIDVVADQTKLIAFNAALEASSAGDAGRRFGVVAVEIRRLADSVSESTTEISKKVNKIQESINRLVITSEKGTMGIQAGLEEVSVTATRLTELVDAVHHTNNAAQQISLSTEQQKIASSQVVLALREIVVASSNTADSVERISHVAKEMVGLSSELNTLVGRFTLSH